jgi:hypothetical protein
VPIVAVVACVAVLALVAERGSAAWKRAARRVDARAPQKDVRALRDSVEAQVTRLEQAVDAIAVEVERMGENQRYLTKLLADEPPENVED